MRRITIECTAPAHPWGVIVRRPDRQGPDLVVHAPSYDDALSFAHGLLGTWGCGEPRSYGVPSRAGSSPDGCAPA